MKKKTALIAGATGLVGKHLLRKLIQDNTYEKIIAVTRSPLPEYSPKVKQLEVDWDRLENYKEQLKADHVFCCLGTTMKKAGSKIAFYKVDHTYVYRLAKYTFENGAEKFLVVSAMGADHTSKFYYNRVKGEMETDVQKYVFPAMHIFRPSLLLGNRDESRIGEKIGGAIAKILSPIMIGPLKKYSPIEAETVAKAMVVAAHKRADGVGIYKSEEIKEIAKAG